MCLIQCVVLELKEDATEFRILLTNKRICVLLVVKKLICVRLFCTAADKNMPDNFSIGYITSSSRGAYNLFRKQNN